MPTLGLGQLTAIDVTPIDYIAIAADTGVDTVSLFVNPMGSIQGECLTTPENAGAVKKQLQAAGIRVANIEVFPLAPGVEVDSYRSSLELGADLSARSVTILLYDDDESRVFDNVSRMCDMAAEFNLKVGIEFMPLAPKWTTLPETAELVKQINKPNLGIGIDLLHLIRSGGTTRDVAATDPAFISYAQLCDSHDLSATRDYTEEATADRLAPGEGAFPIREFLKALPEGTPLELEVPQKSDKPAAERVKAIVEAARKQIEEAGI